MTDVQLGQLGYGAANLGNFHRVLSDEECFAILDAAWDAGIRYFDTAPHYGLGLSEVRLGAFLKDKPRDEYVISTKAGRLLRPNPDGEGTLDLDNDFHVPAATKRVWDFSTAGIETSLTESLERLGLDRVDVLYLHDPERHDLERGIAEAVPALVSLRDAGLVSAIGVGSMVTGALLASARTGMLDLLMVAGRYTLAEQPALAEVFPACESAGTGIVNASVFNSGLLASDNPGPGSRFEYGEVPSEVLERVLAIAAVCHEYAVDLPTAALQFAGRHAAVRSVVIAGSRPAQVTENAARMAEPVPDELWDALTDRGLVPQ